MRLYSFVNFLGSDLFGVWVARERNTSNRLPSAFTIQQLLLNKNKKKEKNLLFSLPILCSSPFKSNVCFKTQLIHNKKVSIFLFSIKIWTIKSEQKQKWFWDGEGRSVHRFIEIEIPATGQVLHHRPLPPP